MPGHTDPSKNKKDTPPARPEKESLYAERWKDFFDALERLYIRDNISGRLKFRKEWEHAAHHVFGPDLMEHDLEGTLDSERRRTLEDEAEERRLALVETLSTLEKSSAESGGLKISFVKDLIEELGRDIVSYIYAPKVLDKADLSHGATEEITSQETETQESSLPQAPPVRNRDKTGIMPLETPAPPPPAPKDRARLPKGGPVRTDPPPAREDLPTPKDGDLISMRTQEEKPKEPSKGSSGSDLFEPGVQHPPLQTIPHDTHPAHKMRDPKVDLKHEEEVYIKSKEKADRPAKHRLHDPKADFEHERNIDLREHFKNAASFKKV